MEGDQNTYKGQTAEEGPPEIKVCSSGCCGEARLKTNGTAMPEMSRVPTVGSYQNENCQDRMVFSKINQTIILK